jgi:hypothetical protein
METYTETVGRYRILVHEELPEKHKAAYRLKGIDPDNNWKLSWSFDERESAEHMLRVLRAEAADWETYKLVDAGAAENVERPVLF